MTFPSFLMGRGQDFPRRVMVTPNHNMLPHSRCMIPGRLLDQDFGVPLTPEDILAGAVPTLSESYYRPWRHVAAIERNIASRIKTDKDKFHVTLDVQHFAPEEISVKTVDGFVVVECNHAEKKDEHGFISRQFMRRYALPDNVLPEKVESRLSSDGVLTITAPMNIPEALKGERVVPVVQTGPVNKEVKDPEPVKTDET